ncbi:M28 family peptidase, partial [candidate division WOR-3 bacterium]|nr:M28 family peptidase [candidate division WOR-3 bacterium]
MKKLFSAALLGSVALAGILKVEVADAPRLAGISIYGFADNWLLVDDSPESRARLASTGVAYEKLPGPASHAVVLPSGLELRGLSSDEARELRRAGTDVTALPTRPFPLRLPDERNIPRRVLQDTFIQRIISKVSPDSIRARMARLQAVRTRYTPAESCRAAEQYLFDYLSSLGLDSVQFDAWGGGPRNVIGTRLGRTRPDVIIVIGGHMDATSEDPMNLAPGMEDNASGTCAAIEAARVLAGENLDYTVKFCAFTGEEQALNGSDHYARLLRSRNTDVIAMLNYDMISWPGDSWGMALAGLAKRLGQYERAIMDEYTTLHHRLAVRSFPSDSRSFDLVGYPAMSGFEYGSRGYIWYHTTADTLGNCNMNLAAEATQAAVATLVSLAVAPLAPEGLRLADCGNGTSLQATWTANSEPDLAGYKLLWGTASTVYSDSITIGRVLSHRIDGLVPGNRCYASLVAVDSAGHESGTAPEDSAVPAFKPLPPSGVACWPFYFGNRAIWNRNRELDIRGYYVYRSTLPDTGFVRLTSALITDTLCRDSMLRSDTMYYYRVTAV